MVGFSGQQVAQDVDPAVSPLVVQSQLAQLQEQQSAASLASQTLPTSVARAKSALTGLDLQNTGLGLQNVGTDLGNQKSALQLAQTKQAAALQTSQLNQAAIANVANDPTTNATNWDQRFGKLAAAGNDEAAPLVGQYSDALHDRIAKGYTLQGLPTGAAATTDQSGAPGVDAGAQPTDFTRMFANMPPAQLQQSARKLDDLDAAIQRVEASPNPVAQFAIEAPKFGQTQPVDPARIPGIIQTLKAQVEPARTAIHGWLIRQGAGMAAPTAAPSVASVGGGEYAINTGPGGEPSATPIIAPNDRAEFVGTNAAGLPMVLDRTTGAVHVSGSDTITPKNAVPRTPFALKQAAWLNLHPGDQQGALDFADGKKAMTPDQIATYASSQAARDLQALSLAGSPPQDAAAFLTNATAQHVAALSAAASPGAPAAPGAGGAPAAPTTPPPASAQAQLQDGKPFKYQNGQVWTKKGGKPVFLRYETPGKPLGQ